jgi:hypothetical protein
MKYLILTLFVLGSFGVFGQSKKEVETAVLQLKAAMLAEDAMLEAIDAARLAKIEEPAKKFTMRQRKAISQAQKIMADAGLLAPQWWTHRSAYEIAQAGLDAVREYKA